MMDRLKPCPFCGGEARLRYFKPLGWVQCKKCGATSAAVSDYYEETDGKEQAVAAWNRRAQPENEPLTLSELRGMGGEPVWI